MVNKNVSENLRALDSQDQDVIRAFFEANQRLLQQFMQRTEKETELKSSHQ